MSNASNLQALEYEAETTFGEDVVTFATHRIPIVGPLDLKGIKHDKIESGRVMQRLQEGTPHILGVQDGSFKIKIYETGHGVTMVGSPTVDPVEVFKSYFFGNPASNGLLSAAASTTATGGTAIAITTTASATFSAGGLFRMGVKGDTKADGQMYPIATHVTTTLTPLIALRAAPAAADVIYPCVVFNFPEDPTGGASSAAAVTGLRFRYRSANLAVELHGCYPTALAFTGGVTGEIPFWEVTFGISWWRYTATSNVSAVACNQYNPAPTASGTFCVNDVGTATRAGSERICRSLSVMIKLGVVPLIGPGGANQFQKIVGARRTSSDIKIKWVEDADAATATPVLDGYHTGTTSKHVMYTLNTTDGKAIGFYFPNVRISGARPFQMIDNGINRLEIEGSCHASATTTSDLTLSAMRIGCA